MDQGITLDGGGLSPLARGTQLKGRRYPVNTRFIPAGAGNTSVHNDYVCHAAVYPRWRGEHLKNVGYPVYIRGLSPLARGTQLKGRRYPVNTRFIPAGAGNTSVHNDYVCHAAVYPRWRGEHLKNVGYPVYIRGLSPLARGTH